MPARASGSILYFSASKLQWLVREEPEVRRRLESGDALLGTIDTYLIYRLTGGAVFATDATNASRTLLFDLHAAALGRGTLLLVAGAAPGPGRSADSTATFGETTLDGFLPKPVPICGVIGDSQGALLAHHCVQPGATKVTFGTGSSILMNIGATPRFSERGVLTALAWVCRGVPAYAFEGIIISSAATLAWLRDGLGLIAEFAECEALAGAVPDTGGVFLVPAFAGLGLPYWEPSARGAILGLTGGSDRRHIVRAALEAIAYQLADALSAMRQEAGVPLGGIRADGGATESRLLMQFTADLTRTGIEVAADPECSSLGAVLAGRIGLGHLSGVEALAEAPARGSLYRPAMPAARALELHAGWTAAVRRVLPLD